MTAEPPPERPAQPLGFEARPRRDEHSVGGSLPETRSLQRDLIGQVVGGRYIIRGILGEGGMGTVYDAEHTGLARGVAIKVLSPSQARKRVAVKRFQQEARAAGGIGHPNICEVYDMGLLEDGSPYLVMEKLVGQTLADHIAREGGLPFDEVVDIMMQVLSGLIAAHEKGIVHRDIKPENIFLAQRMGLPPIAKILDFGVSKMMRNFLQGGEDLDLTRTGMVMGTPYYMSPEQARGERNLDGRVDVYACGVMMYEALVGKRPFLAPNYNALLLSIISTTPKSIREVRPATPPILEQIVQKAMMKARDDRYPSAHHMVHDLMSVAASRSNAIPRAPTTAERARAPQVGGGASGAAHRQGAASAKLRAAMSAGPPPSDPRTDQTRVDLRKIIPPLVADASSDSIEIPVHLTGSDLSPVSADPDEPATEIFRPGLHPSPQVHPGYGRHGAPVPPPQPTARMAPPAPGSAPAMPPFPPAPAQDDWDSETVVRRPAFMTPQARHAPAPARQPFNPEETIKLGSDEVEIDFGDETQIAPPRKR